MPKLAQGVGHHAQAIVLAPFEGLAVEFGDRGLGRADALDQGRCVGDGRLLMDAR